MKRRIRANVRQTAIFRDNTNLESFLVPNTNSLPRNKGDLSGQRPHGGGFDRQKVKEPQ